MNKVTIDMYEPTDFEEPERVHIGFTCRYLSDANSRIGEIVSRPMYERYVVESIICEVI